jgi:hypothetical protein
MKNKEELFEQIKKRSIPLENVDDLLFGQLLLTGLSNGVFYSFDSAVGFVCQVRKCADTNGGDVLLLRHPDESLVCYLNQGFFVVPHDLAVHALQHFNRGVETEMVENPDLDYTIGEHLNEKGFIVPEREKIKIDN